MFIAFLSSTSFCACIPFSMKSVWCNFAWKSFMKSVSMFVSSITCAGLIISTELGMLSKQKSSSSFGSLKNACISTNAVNNWSFGSAGAYFSTCTLSPCDLSFSTWSFRAFSMCSLGAPNISSMHLARIGCSMVCFRLAVLLKLSLV